RKPAPPAKRRREVHDARTLSRRVPHLKPPSPIPGGTGAVRLEAASEELAHPERAVGSASDADSNGIEMGTQQVCAMRGAVPERAVRVDDGRRVRDVLAREGRREPRGLEAPF